MFNVSKSLKNFASFNISPKEVETLRTYISNQTAEIEELKEQLKFYKSSSLAIKLEEANNIKSIYLTTIDRQNKELNSLKTTIANERSTLSLVLQTLKSTNDLYEHTLLKSKLNTRIGSLRATDFIQ